MRVKSLYLWFRTFSDLVGLTDLGLAISWVKTLTKF